MAIDKLRYESQNVSIAREIQKYPKHLGIREIIQNSIEGDGKTGATDIQILSLQTNASGLTGNAPKFAVWDNGPGMDANSLKKLTDMASSTKQMRGTNNDNFGRGEIVSTLSYNSYGVWWISCKDGKINIVWIRKQGQDYGRERFDEACDINNSTVVIDITEDSEIIDSFREQYPDLFTTDRTWTLKVCLGDTDAQDTCKLPFGNSATRVGINWAYNELYKRYHHIPGSNFKINKKNRLVIDDKKVQITFNEGTFSSNTTNGSKIVFSTEPQDFTKTLTGGTKGQLDAEQEVCTDKETGISIVFDFDGYQKNKTTKRASWNAKWRAVSGQSVCIVYHGEMYDRRDGNKFHPFMRNFGAYKGADQFSITIILPETYDDVYPDSDRQVLKWDMVPIYSGGEQDESVTVYDFDEVIRRVMPDWFQQKINETRKSFKPSEDMLSRLQEYINSLFQNDKSSKIGKTTGSSNKNKGDGTGGRGPDINERKSRGKSGIKGGKEGSTTFIPPTPVPLSETEFNQSEDSKFKAASYISSQNEVLINTEYTAITNVANSFVEEHQNDALKSDVNEKIYERIHQLVVDEFSFRLLCSVCKGIHHKRKGKWEEGDVDSVYLNPTALSGIADSIQDYILDSLTKKVKGDVTLIKNADKTTQAQEVDRDKWEANGAKFPKEEVA